MYSIAGRHEKAVKEMQKKHAEKVLAEKKKRSSGKMVDGKRLSNKSTGERWSEVVNESQSTEQKKFEERRRMTLINGYRTTIDTGLVKERKRGYEELILQLSSSAIAVRNTVAAGFKQIKQGENNKERTSSTHSSNVKNNLNNVNGKGEEIDNPLDEFVLGTTKIYGLDFITEDGLTYLSEYKNNKDNHNDVNDVNVSANSTNTRSGSINLRDSTSSPISVNNNGNINSDEEHIPLYAGLYGTTDNHALSITAAGLKSNEDFFIALTIAATNDTNDKEIQSVLGRQKIAVVGLKSNTSKDNEGKEKGEEERVVILEMEISLVEIEGQVIITSPSSSQPTTSPETIPTPKDIITFPSSSQPTSPEIIPTPKDMTISFDSLCSKANIGGVEADDDIDVVDDVEVNTDDVANVDVDAEASTDVDIDANTDDVDVHVVTDDDAGIESSADADTDTNTTNTNDGDTKMTGKSSDIDVVDVVDDVMDIIIDTVVDEKENEIVIENETNEIKERPEDNDKDDGDEDNKEIDNADTSIITTLSDEEPNISLHTVATADVTMDVDNTFSSPLLSRLSLGSPQALSEPRDMKKKNENSEKLLVDMSVSDINSDPNTPINTGLDPEKTRSISLSNPNRASNPGSRIIISGWVTILPGRPTSPFSSPGIKRFLVLWNTLLLVFTHRPEHDALENNDATVLLESAEDAFTLGPGCIAKRKWTMFSRKTMISIESLRPGLLNGNDINGNDIYNTNANANVTTATDSSINTSTSSVNTSEDIEDDNDDKNRDHTDLSVSIDDISTTSSSLSNSSPTTSPSPNKTKSSKKSKSKKIKTSMLFTCSADEEGFWLEGLDQVCYAQRLGTLN